MSTSVRELHLIIIIQQHRCRNTTASQESPHKRGWAQPRRFQQSCSWPPVGSSCCFGAGPNLIRGWSPTGVEQNETQRRVQWSDQRIMKTTRPTRQIQLAAYPVSYRLVVGWIAREDVLNFDLVFWSKIEFGILVVM